jgi:hypothetical protein
MNIVYYYSFSDPYKGWGIARLSKHGRTEARKPSSATSQGAGVTGLTHVPPASLSTTGQTSIPRPPRALVFPTHPLQRHAGNYRRNMTSITVRAGPGRGGPAIRRAHALACAQATIEPTRDIIAHRELIRFHPKQHGT